MTARKPRPPGAEADRSYSAGVVSVYLARDYFEYNRRKSWAVIVEGCDRCGVQGRAWPTKAEAWPTYVATVAALARLKVALAAAGWRDL